MSPTAIRKSLRQVSALALSALLLLGWLPNSPAGTARAFMPTATGSWGLAASPLSHTHTSMTEDVFKDLSKEFFGITKLKKSMTKAMGQITSADADVDQLSQLGGTQFDKSASHFDGEAFPESQQRLVMYSLMVQNLLKNNAPNEARWYLGQALHTLQDFYSHSNWVELGNSGAFDRLGVRGDALDIRLPVNVDTCLNCTRNDCPDCIDILTTNQLTTGYYGGDDRPKPHRFKCSHGGRLDDSALGAYGAGLNKDTRACPLSPHWQLHEQAAAAAHEATRLYIRRIKDAVGIEKTGQLFGVGATLAFAIDTTGSMGSVIAQVQQQATQIVDSRLGTDEEPSKYVLAPFNDPSVGPIVETDDADVFKNAISALTAEGGDDCPELAMAGTLQAVNATDAGGNVMVFTDATARDGELSGSVAALAQSKNVQVSPVLFGSCSPIDPAYIRLADETGGQLFFLSRSEAGQVTKLADFNVRSNNVNLLAARGTAASLPRAYSVPVDSTMTRVTFSVSGSRGVVVTRPDGSVVQPTDTGVSAVMLATGTAYSITAPAVGQWGVAVNSFDADSLMTEYSVSVSGESDINFASFRFVQAGGRPGHEGYFPINGLPVAGQSSAVVAAMTAGQISGAQFELRAPDGTLLQTLGMEEVITPQVEPALKEFFGNVVPPNRPFLAYVTGQNLAGQTYQRLVPGSIKPQTVKISTPGLDELTPGLAVSYTMRVTNLGAPDTFTFTGADDEGFIRGGVPATFSLNTNETRNVTIQVEAPLGTTRGTFDSLSFTVQGAGGATNRAVVTTIVTPGPDLRVGSITATPVGGDGDAFIEPNETGALTVELNNAGIIEATNVVATLSTSTPGVVVTNANASYPLIPEASGAVNGVPFRFRLAGDYPCGRRIDFTLTLSQDGFGAPTSLSFSVTPGEPAAATPASYTGPPVFVPDANPAGVSIPFEVSGIQGGISDLDFRFDGSACTTAPGATTVGLDHTFVGDLVVKLTSPRGTTVTLINQPGGDGGSGGDNFCQTLFDDEGGGRPIQSVEFGDAPHTGTFTPASPLSAFDGEDPNGTWRLNVTDMVGGDTGSVRAFTLLVGGTRCDSAPSGDDSQPPETTAGLTPGANAAGWHNADVAVQLSAADEESGVAGITYSATGAQTIPPTTVGGDSAALVLSAEGTTTLTFYATDGAGNVEAAQSRAVKIDKSAPTISIGAPAGTYLLNQSVSALFSCDDLLSGLLTCAGSVPSGSAVNTSLVGAGSLTVSSTDAAGNAGSRASSYAVAYNVRLLYDTSKSHQSGSTVPIKLQLTDAFGANVSSSGVVVTALNVLKQSDYASSAVEDAGNANPDSNFRFAGGGYIFNLKTTGLTRGTYVVVFKAGADPTTHAAQFQIK